MIVDIGPWHIPAHNSGIWMNTVTQNLRVWWKTGTTTTATEKCQSFDTSTACTNNFDNLPTSTTTIVSVKYQPTDTKWSCASDNNIHDIIQSNTINCASNNNIHANIQSNDINQSKSGVEPILINNSRNATTLTYQPGITQWKDNNQPTSGIGQIPINKPTGIQTASINNVLDKQASGMEELLANVSTTNTYDPTRTSLGMSKLLTMQISGMNKLIIVNASTSYWYKMNWIVSNLHRLYN